MAKDRRFFIFNAYETKMLAVIFLFSSIPIFIISGFFLTFFGDLAYTYLDSQTADHLLKEFLAVAVIMLLYNFIFVGITACYFVHKLYGPLPRILHHLDEIIVGRTTSKIYLRKGDVAGELISRINALIGKIKP